MRKGVRLGLLFVASLTAASAAWAYPGGVQKPDAWFSSDAAGNISSRWDDLSDNGRHLDAYGSWSLSTADATHNFHPYTTGFTSFRNFRNYSTQMVPSAVRDTPLTIFTVTRTGSYVSGRRGRITGLDSTFEFAGEPGLSLYGSGSSGAGRYLLRPERRGGDDLNLFHPTPVPLGQNVLLSAVIGGNDNRDITVGLNGAESTVRSAASAITRGDNLMVGYGVKDDGDAFQGDIMEVLWYVGELSAQDRRRVTSYLAIKYGFDPLGNLHGGDDTLIWNDGLDAGHNSHLFGLGRDDASRLKQKVSRSVSSSALTVALQNNFTASNRSNARSVGFGADLSYFLMGSNGADMALTSVGAAAPYSLRSGRSWLVQSHNFSQTVSMKFELPTAPANSNAKFYLVKRSGNADFAAGSTVVGEIDASTGVINDVSLANGEYFTIVCTLDTDGDGVLDAYDAFPNDPN